MEKLISGTAVKTFRRAAGNSDFCDFAAIVKKGHGECGDSIFVYADGRKFIAAVFDGVSGEAGAALASSAAAGSMLAFLKKHDTMDEETIKAAFVHAQENVAAGFTTAAVLFLQNNGRFTIAAVGDSPIYGLDKSGDVGLELPLSRPVGDNDSILKFFTMRGLVKSVLGLPGAGVHINLARGILSKGEVLILASDGLTDNLYMGVSEGYVTDSSGKEDLKALIGKEREPQAIVRILMAGIKKRLKGGRKDREGGVLVPKDDDVAIVAVRYL